MSTNAGIVAEMGKRLPFAFDVKGMYHCVSAAHQDSLSIFTAQNVGLHGNLEFE